MVSVLFGVGVGLGGGMCWIVINASFVCPVGVVGAGALVLGCL